MQSIKINIINYNNKLNVFDDKKCFLFQIIESTLLNNIYINNDVLFKVFN